MPETKYTYSIQNDITAQEVSGSNLEDEIHASSIVTAFDRLLATGDVLDLFFKDALSAGDKTILDGVVQNHDPVEVFDTTVPVKVVEQPPIAAGTITLSGDAIKATATKNTTTNIDLKLTKDKIIQGGYLFNQNAVFGDWVEFQIIDIDNILGLGANTIIAQFINKWYINSEHSQAMKISTRQGKKILKDLYVRCIYHSIGTVDDVEICINYILSEEV